MSQIYGKSELGWRVESYAQDQTGAITIEVSLPFKADPELRPGNVLMMPELPEPPAMPGYGFMRATWRRLKDGGYGFVYTYGGHKLPSGGEGVPDEELGAVWSGAGSFRQRSILTHPNFLRLKTLYGWDELRRAFAEKMPENSKGAWDKRAVAGESSPLYGVTNYDDLSLTLTKTWTARSVPMSLFTDSGQIVPVPWKALGRIDDRDFMVLPGTFQPHGDFFRLSQSYLLSAPGGHNKDVYGPGLTAVANGGAGVNPSRFMR